jgi:hypothetical protein
VNLPPLRVFTFIPVTGQIISRQVLVEEGSAASAGTTTTPTKANNSATITPTKGPTGKGTPTGAQTPVAPKPIGTVHTESLENEPKGSESGEEGESGEDGDNLEAELKKLESMQAPKASNGKTKKKKGDGEEPAAKKLKTK